MLQRYKWGLLNKQQVGAYCEYFVKMEMTMYGFQVYTTEVDDRGIDFVCRYGSGAYIEIQVKSVRSFGNIFLLKSKFELDERLYLALGMLLEGSPPDLYLIPSLAWRTIDATFGHNDYGEGYKSKPEWRLNLSARNLPSLEPYRFENSLSKLTQPVTKPRI